MNAVTIARGWIGTPYCHQASLMGVGCDCLGLVRGVHAALTGDWPVAPPYAADWAESDPAEQLIAGLARRLLRIGIDEKQPGDVLVFRFRAHLPARHAAILSGPYSMIHAHAGASVAEVALTRWWLRHCAAAFRFPEPVARS
jgi:NlpC/P60 family putative phage cell wall peptidase